MLAQTLTLILLTAFNIHVSDCASHTKDAFVTYLSQKKHKVLGCAGRQKEASQKEVQDVSMLMFRIKLKGSLLLFCPT